MRVLKKLLFIFILGISLQQFAKSQTGGFSLSRIQSNLPYCPEWEVSSPTEIAPLDQSFHYLGQGAQNFAFVSDDGNYVLKFYRHHRAGHPLHFLTPVLPSTLKKRLIQTLEKRQSKRLKAFQSYKIAFDHFVEETGLITLHMNQTNHLNKKIKIFDKMGILHLIDLDRMVFILQKRGTPFYPTLEKWIHEENYLQAQKGLYHLVHLLKNRCMKGIFDKDPDLKTNFGFVGFYPIQFDVGRFKMDPDEMNPKIYQEEITRITDPLCQWLEKKAPPLAHFIREEIEKL